MRWEAVMNNSSNEVYHLWNKDRKVLTLTLHPFSNTARVECDDEKRVFLIRKEGFRRHKTVVRNEYGIKVGELGTEDKQNFIDINDERFYYTVRNNPLAELVIYKEFPDKPFVICELNVENGNPSFRFSKDKELISHPSLLMALCWYMFLPVDKENIVEYAV